MPGACERCGAPATARCTRCRRANFCNVGCQTAAWPTHRGPCAVDARLEASRSSTFKLSYHVGCLHGGPILSSVPEASLAVAQLLPALKSASPLQQLELVRGFAIAQPALSVAPTLLRLLFAAAVDEAAAGDDDSARAVARAAVFFECLAHQGSRFLAGLADEASLADAPSSVHRYLAHIDAATDHQGLLRELRARTPTCSCFESL